MPSRAGRRLSAALLCAFGASVAPALLVGQTDPRLVAALRQAREGQGDSARATVQQLLAKTASTDTLYPQILFTSGLIASDAGEMKRKFQRVTVEFPTSSWTDDALLHLAQLDYAARQLDAAARSLERIKVDFPDSDLFPQAAYWAGRVYFDLDKSREACRWLADGMARSRDDVEIQTQLGYLYQRCGVASTSGDSAPPPKPDSATRPAQPSNPAPASPMPSAQSAPAPTSSPAKPGPSKAEPTPSKSASPKPAASHYRVQIAAVGSSTAANAAAKKVQALGYKTAMVKENGLIKVRAGSFESRAEAQKAMATIKAKIGGTPFVVSDE